MYIDSVTGTLQSLNDTAGNLNRIKSQYERDRLARAELLNRMGQDETAEKALWDANHSGLLSRLLPNTATGRGAEGAFLEDTPETMQLQSLNPLSDTAQKGQNVLSAFSNAKGGVESLAGLNGELYNGINSKMLDDSGKVVAQGKKFNPVKGDKAFAGELGAYDKETADNAQIEADNRKAQAYNESIPQFKQKYEGNEPDQLNQLADDTLKAIKFYEQRDPQKAAAAYVKYVQTGRAIAQGFQHNFTPLGSEYFFSPKKGGGGGTGEKGEFHLYGDDPLTAQSIFIPESVYRKGEKAVDAFVKDNWPSIYKKGTRLKPAGKNQSDDYDAVKDAQAKKFQDENSLRSNSAWEALVDKYDNIVTSRAKAREKALAELKSQGKDVRMDQFGRYVIIEVAGNNRNVVQSNPEDEVTF